MKTIICLAAFALAVASVSANRCANEPDGTLLPSLQCQFYVLCAGGSEHQVRCQPMGTFFDYRRLECDRRPNVECWDGVTTPTTTTSTTTAVPTEPETSEPEPVEPETTEEPVPETTDDVEETTEPEVETEIPETTTAAGPIDYARMCRNIVVDILAHPADCTKFVVCVMGRYTIHECEPDHIFYPSIRVCGFGNPETCRIF